MSLNVYIPVHLRNNIKIINQLYKLLYEYENNPAYNEVEVDDSFESYNSYLANDPVKTFVKFCLPVESVKVGEYETTINYITHLFYSVKGTVKVIEYMKSYLNLKLNDDFFYSPKKIRLSFKELNTLNDTLFYDLLKNFLNALLYFNAAIVSTATGDFYLGENIKNVVGNKIITYKVIEITATEIKQ
jgi:hypothetical protein